jgi:hypothetical protein
MACKIKNVVLAVVALTGMGVRVDAAYIGLDGVPVSQNTTSSYSYASNGHLSAGEYLDRLWYDLLDEGQYDYLDREQYNLMDGLSYVLGHPAYPKLYERLVCGGIGFESGWHVGFLGFYDGFEIWNRPRRASNGLPVAGDHTAFRSFGAGDYIDRRRYDYLDKGQYYYLDKTQYVLIGGLGYLYGRFSPNFVYDRLPHEPWWGWEKEFRLASARSIPEPSTMAILTFGCLCLGRVGHRRRRGL